MVARRMVQHDGPALHIVKAGGMDEGEIASKLIRLWHSSDITLLAQGLDWYPIVGREIAALCARADVPVEVGCGVVAALSPMANWHSNYRGFGLALEAHNSGHALPHSCHMFGGPRDKASAILAGQDVESVLSSAGKSRNYKTRRFFLNLMGDYEAVTVDRWHAKACGLPGGDKAVSGAEYLLCERATQLAAGELGLLPARLQSALWVASRGEMF